MKSKIKNVNSVRRSASTAGKTNSSRSGGIKGFGQSQMKGA